MAKDRIWGIQEDLFFPFPELETERLRLKQLTLEYAPYVYQMRSNPQVMKYMDTHWHASVEDSQRFIQENLDSYQRKQGLYWVFTHKDSGQPIGDFAFWKIDKRHHRADIGYILHPNYWGKGYMKEAMQAIVGFAFQKLGIHSLEANVNTENEASKRALLKMGFRKEAHFHENYFYNGQYLDSEIYCLVNS